MSPEFYAWTLLAASVAATFVWRLLGVILGTRLDPAGTLFQWVTCVSYAMLAGLVARMIVLPLGALAATPVEHRLIASAAAFAVFFVGRRHLGAGTVAGVVGFVALAYLG